MDSRQKVRIILWERQFVQNELNNLVYGSIEIRDKNIYIHSRDGIKHNTKYIGKYSEELYNSLLFNNEVAKSLKKSIRKYNQELKKLNYVDINLNEKVKLNIDFAKKSIPEIIYKQALLEGINTTFPDTENIVEKGIVNNLTRDEVIKIVNLKHAWDFILDRYVITSNTDYDLLCSINKFVLEGLYYNGGIFRTYSVNIGGTTWKPVIPDILEFKKEINDILNSKISIIDKSICLLLSVIRGQYFIDGNKRTAFIYANHYLISKGKGLIIVKEELIDEFKILLLKFYETNDKKEISEFLKNNCYYRI